MKNICKYGAYCKCQQENKITICDEPKRTCVHRHDAPDPRVERLVEALKEIDQYDELNTRCYGCDQMAAMARAALDEWQKGAGKNG